MPVKTYDITYLLKEVENSAVGNINYLQPKMLSI